MFVLIFAAMVQMSMALPLPADAPECAVDEQRVASMMSSSYDAFDQAAEGEHTWRSVMNRGCYARAAMLIEAYRTRHESSLTADQLRTLNFHAGQILALGDDDLHAAPYFDKARGGTAEWNAYAEAMLAFVKRDRAAFAKARAAYDAAAPKSPRRMVLENLEACFEKPYREAMMCDVSRRSPAGR